MKKQPFCTFILSGLSLTDYGLEIPSPFSSLQLSNGEITSMTSWTLKCVVGGDANRRLNAAAFEALLYSAAQKAIESNSSGGIPVSFMFGWLDEHGQVTEQTSYNGFSINFDVSTSGMYIVYTLTGFASQAIPSSMPSLRIPEVCGWVQPSAILEGLAKSLKVTNYYQLDIDHNDAPTLVNHGALNTSFNRYVRGQYTGEDDYESFPGLLRLSKSYNQSRSAASVKRKYKSLSHVLTSAIVNPIGTFLDMSLTDNTVQTTSFCYWVDEPTMTRPGTIHYKSSNNITQNHVRDTLEYGTANSNILSLNGSYKGVAYNMIDMNFSQLGFALDASGKSIIENASIVNSWSNSVTEVFKTANIINDVNAIASQFSMDMTVQVPGSVKQYEIAQPISLLVMSKNTISPITGIYNIITVSHEISNSFVTTLKLQRLQLGTANQVASNLGITMNSSNSYSYGYSTTSNIISPYHVEFGELYPDFTYMQSMIGRYV